jgi:hypothetical protein
MAGFNLTADIDDVVRRYELSEEQGFLFCLFEAISNSLYCCAKNKEILITINLKRQYKANEIERDRNNFIIGFSISDNGEGFTDENYEKFTKTIYKTNHEGGRGEGRIAFLKVFRTVEIDSVYQAGDKTYNRKFHFDRNNIDDNNNEVEGSMQIGTKISLNDIRETFIGYTKKDTNYYSNEILSHFYGHLHYLLAKQKKFEIRLVDDNGLAEGVINTEKLNQDKVIRDKFTIKDNSGFEGIGDIMFDIVHIKTKNVANNKAFYVVDERSAGEISNFDLPQNILEDETGMQFYYNVYLKSPFFSKFLNESRTVLSLPSDRNKEMKKCVTKEQIENTLKEKIDEFLRYELSVLNKKKEKTLVDALNAEHNNEIANSRAFLYMLSDEKTKDKLISSIKYSDTPQKILAKVKEVHEELQRETIKQINITVEKIKNDKTEDIDFKKLEDKMQNLISRVNAENLINLSSYIMYRKYILDLFNEGLRIFELGRMQNEAFFQNLLLPKKTENNINSNLWLLDELFIYFEGTSEKAIEDMEFKGKKIIRKLTDSEQEQLNAFNKKRLEKRIDILLFPEEYQCIILELKDPKAGLGVNAFQMDKYAELIANFLSDDFPIETFYTYLITDNFNIYDRPTGYRKIYGIEGFVRPSIDIQIFGGSRTIANQYSEVICWKDIYKRAEARNKIFFTKMNIKNKRKHDNMNQING